MRQVYEVMRLELEGKWKVFVVALGLGLLALTSPSLPQWRHYGVESVRAASALIFGAGFLLATGLGFGAAILAGPLVDRRESFFLSRPLGLTRLWLGRYLSVLVLSLGSSVLALAPALLLNRTETMLSEIFEPISLLFILGIVIVLIGLSSLFRILMAARSIWALGVPASLVIVYFVWRADLFRLIDMGLMQNKSWFFGLFMLPLLLASLCAGGLASIRGRADLGRVAKIGGRTVVIILLGLALIQWAGLRWISAASPEDIVDLGKVDAAPEGPWIFAGTEVERFGLRLNRAFLINTETGLWRHLNPPVQTWDFGVFSDDGRRAALLDSELIGLKGEILQAKILDLSRGDAQPKTLAILPLESRADVALSPAGTKMMSAEETRIRIWDVESGRVLVQENAEKKPLFLRVLDSGEAWYFLGDEDKQSELCSVEARHFAAGAKKSTSIWRQDNIYGMRYLALKWTAMSFDAVFTVQDPESQELKLVVRKRETGEIQWTVPLEASFRSSKFFPVGEDAVIAALWDIGAGQHPIRLLRFGPKGVEWEAEVGRGTWAFVGPMTDGKTVAVRLRKDWSPHGGKTLLVDVSNGSLRKLDRVDVAPATAPFWGQTPKPGSAGARLFIQRRSELLRLDPDGKLQPVIYREGRAD